MIITAALLFFLVPFVGGALVRSSGAGGRWSQLLLSFGGAFLLGVVFLHLLPELYADMGAEIGLWVLGGLLLQLALRAFARVGGRREPLDMAPRSMPWMALLGMGIHGFVEGIPFAAPEVASDIPFLVGVLIHKAPMAIALVGLLQRTYAPPGRVWTMLVLLSLAAPLGILFGVWLGEGVGEVALQRMLGVAIGMLLHIGTAILLVISPEHRSDRLRYVAILLGGVLAALSLH